MKCYSAYIAFLTTNIVIGAITSQEDSINNKKDSSSSSSSSGTITPISYVKYQSLFSTEASTNEYIYRNQEANPSTKTSKIWKEQIKFNWEQIKNSPHTNNKSYPFLLCYDNNKLTSRRRHEHILTHVHSAKVSILPFRIKESETCYQLYSTLEQSEHIAKKVNGDNDKVSMIPLSSSMKMFSGSVDTIDQIVSDAYNNKSDGKKKKKHDNPIVVTIDTILCPGIRSNKSDLRTNIKNQVLEHTLNTNKIQEKLFWTHIKEQSKKTKQGKMWEDIVSKTDNDNNNQCKHIYKTIQFTFDEIKFHTMNNENDKITIMSKMSMVFSDDGHHANNMHYVNENIMN